MRILEKLWSDARDFCKSIGGVFYEGGSVYLDRNIVSAVCRFPSPEALSEKEDEIARFIERKDEELGELFRKVEKDGSFLLIDISFYSSEPFKRIEYVAESEKVWSKKEVNVAADIQMDKRVLALLRDTIKIPPDCECSDTMSYCVCSGWTDLSGSIKQKLKGIREEMKEILSATEAVRERTAKVGRRTYLVT